MMDIYFEEKYGELYEEIENGKCENFEFSHELGKVSYVFLKRNICEDLYDIVSPYGYGGPIIKACINGREKELVNEFQKAFSKYCEEQNIVTEFVRFHPILENYKYFKDIYDIEYSRKTVGTNLLKFDDPFTEEFSKSCRKNVRSALSKGVSFKVTKRPEGISEFKKIYFSTMDRNNAKDYYYFDDVYFEKCVKLFKNNLLLVEAIYEGEKIAMGLYFIYDKTIHIHLSGTLSEYLHLSPAYILRYAVTIWGKENNYELIHHGGGRTNSPDDSLYTFKKQFGKNTDFDFYIGKKIWKNEIYLKLCKDKKIDPNTDYFPAYRLASN